jgi:hypothetical protein
VVSLEPLLERVDPDAVGSGLPPALVLDPYAVPLPDEEPLRAEPPADDEEGDDDEPIVDDEEPIMEERVLLLPAAF